MFRFFRETVSALRPACSATLPSITATVDEVARATQSSTQRALEQTEVLSGHLGRLAETLTRLEAHVSIEREGRAAWSEAVEACLAMTPAVRAIVRAMEFRDPAGERLRDAIQSAETLRGRFAEVLALLNVQPGPEPVPQQVAPSPFRAPAVADAAPERGSNRAQARQ
jgi:maltooligosyltrehalose synthase